MDHNLDRDSVRDSFQSRVVPLSKPNDGFTSFEPDPHGTLLLNLN